VIRAHDDGPTFLRTADDGVAQRLNPDSALVGRPADELVHLRLSLALLCRRATSSSSRRVTRFSLALVDEVHTATVTRVAFLTHEQLGQRYDARLHTTGRAM